MRSLNLKRIAIMASSMVMIYAVSAHAAPTRVTVRAIAKGSKFIGTSMGGARIIIRDVDTGELLAQGVTQGSTGDTARIMTDPRRRGEPLSTPDAAGFTTTLELDRPRLVEIEAYGPLAQRQAITRATVTQWLIPGQDIVGDGVVLELPGLVVDVLAPAAHASLGGRTRKVDIDANITMMCGCPITPGGLWDANQLRVSAVVKRDGKTVGTHPLRYAGTTSRFIGSIDVTRPGTYEIVVLASDPLGNTGLDATTFIVQDS